MRDACCTNDLRWVWTRCTAGTIQSRIWLTSGTFMSYIGLRSSLSCNEMALQVLSRIHESNLMYWVMWIMSLANNLTLQKWSISCRVLCRLCLHQRDGRIRPTSCVHHQQYRPRWLNMTQFVLYFLWLGQHFTPVLWFDATIFSLSRHATLVFARAALQFLLSSNDILSFTLFGV